MIKRKAELPPEHIYPIDDWKLTEKSFHPEFLAQNETMFTVANGYLGMRGNFDEGRPAFQSGTFINGFHESWPIVYGEEAYGFAKTGQTMLNVPETKIINLYVDDEPFYIPTATMPKYERVLDMRAGTLDRSIIWETASGKQVAIKSRRLVSFEHRHLAAIYYEVTILNAEAPVVISSKIVESANDTSNDGDPRKARRFDDKVLLTKETAVDDLRMVLGYATKRSGMTLAVGVDHIIETECPCSHESELSEGGGKSVFTAYAHQGVPIKIIKYITYHNSRSAPPEELCGRADRTLDRALDMGLDSLLDSQKRYMAGFWDRHGVDVVANDSRVNQCLHYNIFTIIQAAGRAEGTGVGAKGLTGQAYEGHYFWDTEIYLLPFLIYNEPRIAKNLLKFRFSMLDKARRRAREVNQKGALFPWRTINGEEASAYFAAGTAQYHINADIMYALKKYVDVTGDNDFLYDIGAEMLVETARLWHDLGHFSDGDDNQFHIHGVTGPDEYNAIVNNNTYTNMMACFNLTYAFRTVEHMREHCSEKYAALVHKTRLDLREVEEWKRAAEKMHIPYNEELGIHPQDDSFLEKKKWNLKNTPPEKFPLLLYYHPLVIYRHQVIKQADIVLAMFLFGKEFSQEQKRRNFDYYDPLTTGDSSLSACIQSILAAEIGYMDKAITYSRYALLMDLSDIGGNVKDGAHIACMGGTWMTLVYGYCGMRDHDGTFSFHPKMHELTRRVKFNLTIRGMVLAIDFSHDGITYLLKDGDGLTIWHRDEKIDLQKDKPVLRPLCD